MTGPIRSLGRRALNKLLLRDLVYETRNEVGLLMTEMARIRRETRQVHGRLRTLSGGLSGQTDAQLEVLADQALEHRIALQQILEGQDPGGQAMAGLAGLMGRLLDLPGTRPEALARLTAEIRARRPETVVECGLGVSSLLIAEGLREQDRGRLHGLDGADDGPVAALQAALARAGLREQAVLCAPEGGPAPIPPRIDLLVLGRVPSALPDILSRLTPGAAILLHGAALLAPFPTDPALCPGHRGRDFRILIRPA